MADERSFGIDKTVFFNRLREALPKGLQGATDDQLFDTLKRTQPEQFAKFNFEDEQVSSEDPGFLDAFVGSIKQQAFRTPQVIASTFNVLSEKLTRPGAPLADEQRKRRESLYNTAQSTTRNLMENDPALREFNQWAGTNPFEWSRFVTEGGMFGRVFGQTIASMGTIIGAAAIGSLIGGPKGAGAFAGSTAFALESSEAYGNILEEAKKKGYTPEEIDRLANEGAMQYGITSAVLETIVPLGVMRSWGFSRKAADKMVGKYQAIYSGKALQQGGKGGAKIGKEAMETLVHSNVSILNRLREMGGAIGLPSLAEGATELTQFLTGEAIEEQLLHGQEISFDWLAKKLATPEAQESLAGGLLGGGFFAGPTGLQKARGFRGTQLSNVVNDETSTEKRDEMIRATLHSDDLSPVEKAEFMSRVSFSDAEKAVENIQSAVESQKDDAVDDEVKKETVKKPTKSSTTKATGGSQATSKETSLKKGTKSKVGKPKPLTKQKPDAFKEPSEPSLSLKEKELTGEPSIFRQEGTDPSRNLVKEVLDPGSNAEARELLGTKNADLQMADHAIRNFLRFDREFKELNDDEKDQVRALVAQGLSKVLPKPVVDKDGNFDPAKLDETIQVLRQGGVAIGKTFEDRGLQGQEEKFKLIKAPTAKQLQDQLNAKAGKKLAKKPGKKPATKTGRSLRDLKDVPKDIFLRAEKELGKKISIDPALREQADVETINELVELKKAEDLDAKAKQNVETKPRDEAREKAIALAEKFSKSRKAKKPTGIDINLAKDEDFKEIGGVGKKTIAKVRKHIEKNGPISNIDDLLSIKGLGKVTAAKLAVLLPEQVAPGEVAVEKPAKKGEKKEAAVAVEPPPNIKAEVSDGFSDEDATDAFGQPALAGTVAPPSTDANEILDRLRKQFPNVDIEFFDDLRSFQTGKLLSGEALLKQTLAGVRAIVNFNNKTARLDTFPHEFAHIYVAMTRNDPLVKKAIEQAGNEEALVQSIGEYYARRLKPTAKKRIEIFLKKLFQKLKRLFGKEFDAGFLLSERFFNAKETDLSQPVVNEQFEQEAENAYEKAIYGETDDKDGANNWEAILAEDFANDPGLLIDRHFFSEFGLYLNDEAVSSMAQFARDNKHLNFLNSKDVQEAVEGLTDIAFRSENKTPSSKISDKHKKNLISWWQKINSTTYIDLKGNDIRRRGKQVLIYDADSGAFGIENVVERETEQEDGSKVMEAIHPVTGRPWKNREQQNFLEEDQIVGGVPNKMFYISAKDSIILQHTSRKAGGGVWFSYAADSPKFKFDGRKIEQLNLMYTSMFMRGESKLLMFFFGETQGDNSQLMISVVPPSIIKKFKGKPLGGGVVQKYEWARFSRNGYEVSSVGDRRFSALNARLKDGRTIEAAYQLDVKGYRLPGDTNANWRRGKGKPPKIKISKEAAWQEYLNLWKTWASENPRLIKDLAIKAKGKVLTDRFATTDVSQARALSLILNESNVSTPRIEPAVDHKSLFEDYLQEEKVKGNLDDVHIEAMTKANNQLSKGNPLAHLQIIANHERWKTIKGRRYITRGRIKNVADLFKRLKIDTAKGTVPRGIGNSSVMIVDESNVEFRLGAKTLEHMRPNDLGYAYDGMTMTSHNYMAKMNKALGNSSLVYKTFIRSLGFENPDANGEYNDYIGIKSIEMTPPTGLVVLRNNEDGTQELIARYDGRTWKDSTGREFDRLVTPNEAKDFDGKYANFGEVNVLPERATRVLKVVNKDKLSGAFPILGFELMLDQAFLDETPAARKLKEAAMSHYKNLADKYAAKLNEFRNDPKAFAGFLKRELQDGEIPTELQKVLNAAPEAIYIPSNLKFISSMINSRFIVDGLYKARQIEKGVSTFLTLKPDLGVDVKDGNVVLSANDRTMLRRVSLKSDILPDGKDFDTYIGEINDWLEENEFKVLVHRTPIQSFTKVVTRRLQRFETGNHGRVIFQTPNDVFHVHEADFDGDIVFVEDLDGSDLLKHLSDMHETDSFKEREKIVNLDIFKKGNLGKNIADYRETLSLITNNAKLRNVQGFVVSAKTMLSVLSFKDVKVKIGDATIQPIKPTDSTVMDYLELRDDLTEAEKRVIKSNGDRIRKINGKLFLETTKENEFSILLQAAVDNAKFGLFDHIKPPQKGGLFEWLQGRIWKREDGKPMGEKLRVIAGTVSGAYNLGQTRQGRIEGRALSLDENIQASQQVAARNFDITGERLDAIESAEMIKAMIDTQLAGERSRKAKNWVSVDSISNNGDITPMDVLLGAFGNSVNQLNVEMLEDSNLLFKDFLQLGDPGRYKSNHRLTMSLMASDIQKLFASTVKESGTAEIKNGIEFGTEMQSDFIEIYDRAENERVAKKAGENSDEQFLNVDYNKELNEFLGKWYPKFRELDSVAQQWSTIYFLNGGQVSGRPITNVGKLLPAMLMDDSIYKLYAEKYYENLYKPDIALPNRDKQMNILLNTMLRKTEEIAEKYCG